MRTSPLPVSDSGTCQAVNKASNHDHLLTYRLKMFTLLYHLQALKWFAPSVFMLGTAPSFFILWMGWRAATALLPHCVFRVGDEAAYSLYQRLVLYFYENYNGLEVVLYGDKEGFFSKRENVILMCNHQSTVDWVIADMLAIRQGSLGHIRYILKDGLRYFPLYGFYFRQHSCIYVKRSGRFEQHTAENQLDEIAKSKTPFWMVIFPEGTRLNKKTLEKGKKYALENGLAELNNVLVPRHKALQLGVERLREVTDAIYDVTVAYSDTRTASRTEAPGLTEFLQKSGSTLHLHLSRIPMSDLPNGDDNIRNWLYDRFQMKDKMMARFFSDDPDVGGKLGDDGEVSRLGLRHTLPAVLTFGVLNTLLLGTKEGRSLYWRAAVIGTTFGWVWMSIRR